MRAWDATGVTGFIRLVGSEDATWGFGVVAAVAAGLEADAPPAAGTGGETSDSLVAVCILKLRTF
ncbi:hypothetical protein [Devriesea agamarum]|uniref:hypothetical protein n=1 Tax=Devriesea agamarum TaxID=472569 RepID=UPI00071D8D93|nr:hypothetical protein [Devriesea agamarum]